MKSATRTVLNVSLVGATSYSSGPLDVGDLYELAIDMNVTASTGGNDFQGILSRIGADGVLYEIAAVGGYATGKHAGSVGAGLGFPASFGDQVQFDFTPMTGSDSITCTLSIKGK